MHGLLITDTNCHLPKGVLNRFPIDRLTGTNGFADRLINNWLYQCDALLAVGSKRPVERWQRLVAQHQTEFADRRLSAQLKHPFYLRLFGSRHGYAALGIMVSTAADLLERQWHPDAIRAQLARTETLVQHYLALPAGSAQWHENRPSWMRRWRRTTAGVMQCQPGREQRLLSSNNPVQALLQLSSDLAPSKVSFNLSYAGDPTSLQALTAFRDWHQGVHERGGRCWLSAMDDASARQCGAGALSLAWISAPARRETP
ncbi:hypothetical protein ABMA57_12520 [Saccharospirillum sp. HFRX-1]|uniref:hypothetical protein n=1 Tax=unclassified Saccharospirillum TaxID=2633430 RepID=UPI00371DC1F9